VTVWQGCLIGAVTLMAVTALADVYLGFRTRRPPWSVWRLGLGLALLLVTAGLGVSLVSVRTEEVPEQLGIAVVVDGARSDQQFDLGLFVSAHVSVTSCNKPVLVRLTLEPTAEFWAANRKAMREGGRVEFGIPDAHVDVHEVLLGQEATVPLPQAGTAVVSQTEVDSRRDVVDGVTTVSVDVPGWGRSLAPVTVVFSADWAASPRSSLGGCYVSLPALTGLPTVVTAARMTGVAWSDPADKPPAEDQVQFLVTSRSPERYALYDPSLEVTKGTTTIDVGSYSIDASRSSPAPPTSIQGTPAWTCKSAVSIPAYFTRDPDQAMSDYMVNQQEGNPGAFSGRRMDAVTGQTSCGSLLALEDSHYGTKRDLGLILVGALFSVAVELTLSAFRHRRPAPES
jgi:hypothetical protein